MSDEEVKVRKSSVIIAALGALALGGVVGYFGAGMTSSTEASHEEAPVAEPTTVDAGTFLFRIDREGEKHFSAFIDVDLAPGQEERSLFQIRSKLHDLLSIAKEAPVVSGNEDAIFGIADALNSLVDQEAPWIEEIRLNRIEQRPPSDTSDPLE